MPSILNSLLWSFFQEQQSKNSIAEDYKEAFDYWSDIGQLSLNYIKDPITKAIMVTNLGMVALSDLVLLPSTFEVFYTKYNQYSYITSSFILAKFTGNLLVINDIFIVLKKIKSPLLKNKDYINGTRFIAKKYYNCIQFYENYLGVKTNIIKQFPFTFKGVLPSDLIINENKAKNQKQYLQFVLYNYDLLWTDRILFTYINTHNSIFLNTFGKILIIPAISIFYFYKRDILNNNGDTAKAIWYANTIAYNDVLYKKIDNYKELQTTGFIKGIEEIKNLYMKASEFDT